MMEELGYRIRPATPEDNAVLRQQIRFTMAHPDGRGRRDSYVGAAQRNELLLLERYNPREKQWEIAGFVEWHMRVDDTLTIRDAGTVGETPHSGIVKQLILELLRSLQPVAATVKVRRDATSWNEIFLKLPGFSYEGSEYRRPHWFNIWHWSREAARQVTRRQRDQRRR